MRNKMSLILLVLISNIVSAQELLSIKKLKDQPVYLHIVDTLTCSDCIHFDRSSNDIYHDEANSEVIKLKNIDKKSYANVYRLVLAHNNFCKNKINYAKFPNLQELFLIDYCGGLDSNDAKKLKKIQILKIMDDTEESNCYIDSVTIHEKDRKMFVPGLYEGLYKLENLVEFSMVSMRGGNNYIKESLFELKKLTSVHIEAPYFFPIGIILHPEILKKSKFCYPYGREGIDLYSIVGVGDYRDLNLLKTYNNFHIPKDGIYEEYYDDVVYDEYFYDRKRICSGSFGVFNKKDCDLIKSEFDDSLFHNYSQFSNDTIYKKKMSRYGEIKDGKLNGRWLYYYPDGKLAQERYYENVIEVGIWKVYNNIIIDYTSEYFILNKKTGYSPIKGDSFIEMEFANGQVIKYKRSLRYSSN